MLSIAVMTFSLFTNPIYRDKDSLVRELTEITHQYRIDMNALEHAMESSRMDILSKCSHD